MNKILKEDIEQIIDRREVDFKALSGKSIFISGATGLIGSNLVGVLLKANELLVEPIHVIAMVRSIEKAESLFGKDSNIEYFLGDVSKPICYEGEIDYIVHAASQTSSKAFVEDPVGVINIAFTGTTNALNLAREKQVKGMVYLSTMEVYGYPETEDKIYENHGTNLNTMQVRTSYPESKRMCETLCTAYASQYGVPVKVMRLTQTFGPGVRYGDGRVFAEFARCAIEKRNIVLHTKGDTKRNYLYTADAVSAIITVLLKGNTGEAYNAANEDTFCSIKEMAELVCKECADNKIRVDLQLDSQKSYGYAPTLLLNLDTSKLRRLGWKAHYTLDEMFKRLCNSMKEELNS